MDHQLPVGLVIKDKDNLMRVASKLFRKSAFWRIKFTIGHQLVVLIYGETVNSIQVGTQNAAFRFPLVALSNSSSR